jgi:hypothetical protein
MQNNLNQSPKLNFPFSPAGGLYHSAHHSPLSTGLLGPNRVSELPSSWANCCVKGWYIWHLDAVIAQSNHWPIQCESLVYHCISQLSFFIATYIMLSQIVCTLHCSALISATKRVVTIISYAWLELNVVVLVKFSSQPRTPW